MATTRSPGRPRLHPKGEKRPRNTESMILSLYPDEAETWKSVASSLGISHSEMGRQLLAQRWVLELTPEEVKAARALVALSRQQ